jgi:hypothetical protein
VYLVALLVLTAGGLIKWWLYLRLCRHVFDKTGDATDLKHVAATARAFREQQQLRLPLRGR